MPAPTPTTTLAGAYVRKLRNKNGWTQDQLAGLLGVTQATVSRVETGGEDMSERFAIRLVNFAGADLQEVMGYIYPDGRLPS